MGKMGRPLPVGLYIVQAPSDEWCPALNDVFRDVYLGNSRPGRKRRLIGSGLPLFRVFELPSTAPPKKITQVVTETQDVLALGQTVIVVAGNLTSVPAALQRASDRIVTVPPPSRRWMAALVRDVIPGTRRLDFRGLACEMVTPSMLRLAYRRGSSARAFIRRLQILTTPAPRLDGGKSVPLDQLHGIDEARSWVNGLKADLARYRRRELAWHQLTQGLLLAGPPGTAKTALANSMADFCGLSFIQTSYAAWQCSGSGHLGDTLKAMAATFAEARARAPALLFIDELDTLGSRGHKGQRDDWWRSIINALLEQMDGSTGNDGVIFVGATNYPELIDPAILRSGRMEERINLRPPSVEALAKIYRDQLAGEISDKLDLQQIGRLSAGMTGADVVKTCRTARRRARNAGRPIKYEDLLVAITGQETQPDPSSQLRVAIHEAGHAIAALAYPQLELDHVTVVGQGAAGGNTLMGPKNTAPT